MYSGVFKKLINIQQTYTLAPTARVLDIPNLYQPASLGNPTFGAGFINPVGVDYTNQNQTFIRFCSPIITDALMLSIPGGENERLKDHNQQPTE